MMIPERIWLGQHEPMTEAQKVDFDLFIKHISDRLDSAFEQTKKESIESGLLSADDWLTAEASAKEIMERAK